MEGAAADWATPLPRRKGDLARSLAPALLLVAIALIGVRNFVVRDQSSWQGVSFGMFATYDNGVSRTVLVTVERDGVSTRVALPRDLRDDARRLAVVPTSGGAHSLAEAVLDRVEGPATVRVEVRGLDLDDGEDLRVDLTKLVEGTARR